MEPTVKQLVVIAGPDKGRQFMLRPGDPVPIGRSVNTATKLNDLRVSRTHCEVRVEGERVILRDCNSATGTFVNDAKITEQPLNPGDVIRIGDTEMQFLAQEVAEAPTLAGD